ncbi:hypothetical protein ElyMa_000862900 [Elysia marginata]|uniref:Secreted protein n=1 Tax=Elysia marginata TaxID=1093978 RepID=A0AAV4H201_9GAST|nr:hypothetical protein ElyMa_000862900 [Elysia marginata]
MIVVEVVVVVVAEMVVGAKWVLKVQLPSILEHRVYHLEEEMKHPRMGKGWMLITSTAEKTTQQSIRGVVILTRLRYTIECETHKNQNHGSYLYRKSKNNNGGLLQSN